MNGKVPPEKIAANAKMARERAGYETQQAAADAIECSRTTVLGWENEKNPTPIRGSQYLLDAARVYRVRPAWLASGEEPDGFPWQESASATAEPPAPIPGEQIDLAKGLEALARSQTYMAQALAATIPTAAREVLSALDNRLPQELREIGYIQTLRSAIVGQLASSDMAAMPAPPKKAHQARRRKPK